MLQQFRTGIAITGSGSATPILANWWWAIGTDVLASLCLLFLNYVSEFLYFQF